MTKRLLLIDTAIVGVLANNDIAGEDACNG
jgi:hypothetical protein